MKDIAVIAEINKGKLTKASIAACQVAQAFAEQLGSGAVALVCGDNAKAAKELSSYVKTIYTAKTLNVAAAATMLNKQYGINGFILPASPAARELAGAISASTGFAAAADCVELFASNGKPTAKRLTSDGRFIEECKPQGEGFVFGLAFAAAVPSVLANKGEIVRLADGDAAGVVSIIQGKLYPAQKKTNIPAARIIVSGGRGCGSEAGYKNFVVALAEKLGGEYTGSRAAVDAGWIPASRQIGLSGNMVSPDLYIAVGISGAGQHIVGMNTSACVIAINKDASAPIFAEADYGIVGDAADIVPAILKNLQSIE